MNWSIETVEKNLLAGKIEALDLAPDVVVAAVDRVEQMLGSEWIKSQTSAKGIMPTMRVVSMGLQLAAVGDLEHSQRLIKRLRIGERGAESELTAIHIFRSCDFSVELYPPVGNREADFRVRKENQQWTTVEVTKPNTSKEEKRVVKILQRFMDVFRKMDFPFALEMIFRREPTESEIASLCAHLPEFCRLSGLQTATLSEGMGFLVLNHVPIGHLRLCEVPEFADTPMIGVTMFVAGGAGPDPLYQVSAQIPFTDTRAKSFLRDEAKQLPKNDVGLVMIEVPGSENHVRAWNSLIKRCFQPHVYTRVSGVCIFSGETTQTEKGASWLPRTDLIVNPYAHSSLPIWVQNALTKPSTIESGAAKSLM